MTTSIPILLAVLSFGVALAVTRLVIPVLARRVMDLPNARSSHRAPTPRGGGIGILAAVLTGWGGLLLLGWVGPAVAIPLTAAGVLALVSFLDDLRPRPAALRLAVQVAAVGAGLSAIGHGAFVGALPPVIDLPLTGFLWLWFINLFNFMDGIDGIAGGEAVCIGLGLALLAALALAPAEVGALGATLGAGGLGFLVWNWHPARVFMGDVGSVPLGYLLGYLLIRTASEGGALDPAGFAAGLILSMVFTLDASTTLLRRLARGKRPTEAHREHVYQRAVIAGRSHGQVSGAVIVANLGLIALAALLAATAPAIALGLAILLVIGLFAWLRPAPVPVEPKSMPAEGGGERP